MPISAYACQVVVNVSIRSVLGPVSPVYYPKCARDVTLLPLPSTHTNSI